MLPFYDNLELSAKVKLKPVVTHNCNEVSKLPILISARGIAVFANETSTNARPFARA